MGCMWQWFKNFLGVLLLLFIAAGAFAIHPLVGLALLITAVWGILHFRSNEKKREQDYKAELEAAERDDEAATALSDQHWTREQHSKQVVAERVAAMTPEERAVYDKEMELVAALEQEIQRLVGMGMVAYHENREKMQWDFTRCKNGHVHPYRQCDNKGHYYCPTCRTTQFVFEGERPGQFRFCPKRFVTAKMQSEYYPCEFFHSFATGLTDCPLCAWAERHNIKSVYMEYPPSDRNGRVSREWLEHNPPPGYKKEQTNV